MNTWQIEYQKRKLERDSRSPQELEEERKKRAKIISDRCSTCDCMYPCSDARSIKPWD
jgi:hypothetical protein